MFRGSRDIGACSIIIMLMCTLALAQSPAGRTVSDREQAGFMGPVMKVFVEWSPIETPGDVRPGTRCRQSTSLYDVRGRLIQHSLYFGSCGGDEFREDYRYDGDGDLTAREKWIRGKDSPPPPPGIANPSADNDPRPSKTVFRYDSAGKLTEEREVRPTGKTSSSTRYEYDAVGRLVEMKSYNEDGQLSVRRVHGYDGNDRFASTFTYYASDGTVGEQTKYSGYEFNSHGDWIKRKAITDEPIWFRRNGVREMRGNRHTVAWDLRQIEYYPTDK
jgi:YD repeat-containing protein